MAQDKKPRVRYRVHESGPSAYISAMANSRAGKLEKHLDQERDHIVHFLSKVTGTHPMKVTNHRRNQLGDQADT